MKIIRAIYIVLFLLPVVIFTLSRQANNKPVEATCPVKVTDFRYKEIRLEKPAERIVCLIESALSGIYMLQAENRVIGVSSAVYNESPAAQYAILDERIRKKQISAPGNWDFTSIESIVSLRPDLVIIWSSQTESIHAIEEHGIPVYGVFLQSINDIYKEIGDLGMLTGKASRADSLIAYTKEEIDMLRLQSSGIHKKRKNVYFMWSQGLLETAGTTSTVNELIELAGAKNSCGIHQEHVIINKEKLLDWNPDVWVMWCNSTINPVDIINTAEFKNLNAVKNKKVYELPSAFMCDLWTLKFPYAVRLLAKWCNPVAFANMDPEAEKLKMLKTLYGPIGADLAK